MATLSPTDREIVISRHLLGLPWAVVAEMLGTTEEAAQMRLHRARRRLAALISPGK